MEIKWDGVGLPPDAASGESWRVQEGRRGCRGAVSALIREKREKLKARLDRATCKILSKRERGSTGGKDNRVSGVQV